jgi:ATP synthase F1 complex assembly factor 2
MLLQEADELYELQTQEWQPILNWFCKRYDVRLEATRDISGPNISQETKSILTKHLLSYNFWAVHGRYYTAFELTEKKVLMNDSIFRQVGVLGIHLSPAS